MTAIVSDRNHLERLRSDLPDLVLLDVRLAEDHAAEHVPGAVNNCVFEVTFLDRMPQLVAGTGTPICVYGHDEDSREAEEACASVHESGSNGRS